MNTVNLSLEEYNRLRDIDLNIEKYRKAVEERDQDHKFKVKISGVGGGYGWSLYETENDCLAKVLEELRDANQKIKDLEDKIQEHEKPQWNVRPIIGFEPERKKFLGIF